MAWNRCTPCTAQAVCPPWSRRSSPAGAESSPFSPTPACTPLPATMSRPSTVPSALSATSIPRLIISICAETKTGHTNPCTPPKVTLPSEGLPASWLRQLEQIHDHLVAGFFGGLTGRLSLCVRNIGLGTGLEQHLHHLGVAQQYRMVERCLSGAVLNIQRHSLGSQDAGQF